MLVFIPAALWHVSEASLKQLKLFKLWTLPIILFMWKSQQHTSLQHPPTSTHLYQSTSPQEFWDLRASIVSWCHHREAQNHSPERFHSLFLAGRINFSPPSGTLNPWQFSSDTWKLTSCIITWLCLKKKTSLLPFLTFALFPLTSHCLDRICSGHCLEICITSTSCVCLPLYNVLLIVFLNCKSLWIKASAKCKCYLENRAGTN